LFDRTVLIGVGGIGSALVDNLAKVIAFQDVLPKDLVLVDPQTFEGRNRTRQRMNPDEEGSFKVEVAAKRIRAAHPELRVSSLAKYVSKNPRESDAIRGEEVFKERSIILSAIDHQGGRGYFSELCRKRRDILMLNGGNRVHDGHVYAYLIQDGAEHTKRLEEIYPNIANPPPEERNPGDLSCEERHVLPGGEQLLATNNMVASWMLAAYSGIIENVPKGKEAVSERFRKKTEVIFDIQTFSVAFYSHATRLPKKVLA